MLNSPHGSAEWGSRLPAWTWTMWNDHFLVLYTIFLLMSYPIPTRMLEWVTRLLGDTLNTFSAFFTGNLRVIWAILKFTEIDEPLCFLIFCMSVTETNVQ